MKVNIDQLREMIKNNEDVSNVDTSEITDMSFLFSDNKNFNQDISKWNVSNVENMRAMFYNCSFNGDISDWDVSNVINMESMFSLSEFNGDISKWNVSKVENMKAMFYTSIKFNQDKSNWDVSNVIDMSLMFSFSYEFNQDISKWNTKNVKYMDEMFCGAYEFNKSLHKLNTSNVITMDSMFLDNNSNKILYLLNPNKFTSLNDFLNNDSTHNSNFYFLKSRESKIFSSDINLYFLKENIKLY